MNYTYRNVQFKYYKISNFINQLKCDNKREIGPNLSIAKQNEKF